MRRALRWSFGLLTLGVVGSVSLFACVGEDPESSNPTTDAQSSPDSNTTSDAGTDPDTSTNDGGSEAGAVVITSIAAGGSHACVVRSDGSVLCWGNNGHGQVGAPSTGNSTCTTGACRPTPTVVGITSVAGVCTGVHHTCAVKTDGTVACWGWNAERQLAQDPAATAESASPVPITGLTGVKQVSCGDRTTCARTATEVYCWGANYDSVAGLPSDTAVAGTPNKIALPEAATDVNVAFGASGSTGGAHACAVGASGAVYCWGAGGAGMLGVPSNTLSACGDAGAVCSAAPKKVKTAAGDLGNVDRVRGGLVSTCARQKDGTVWCWGANQWLALGYQPFDLNEHAAAEKVTTFTTGAGGSAFINDIEAHYLVISAIDATKSIWAWGRVGGGSLGNGTVTGPLTCAYGQMCAAPTKLVAPTDVSALANGRFFSIALTSSGDLWAWGINSAGQLGHAEGTSGDQNCGEACATSPVKITLP